MNTSSVRTHYHNHKKLWAIGALLIAVLTIIIMWLCDSSSDTHHKDKTPAVKVSPLTYDITQKTVISYGITVSPTSVTISAQQPAEITHIGFSAGQAVKKGQLLFKLKINDIDNQLQKLKAQMHQTKSWYERMNRMNTETPGSISKFGLIKAKSQYEQDLAAYNEASALENIRAPVNGIMSDTDLAVGDFVNAGQALATITDPSTLQIKYQLPSQYANEVHPGQTITFRPDGMSNSYHGKVVYISPQFNSNYNLTLRADLNHFSGLRLNQFGEVTQVINPKDSALAIAQGLVQTDAKGFYVYSLNKNKVKKAYFTPGSVSASGLIQVDSGIAAGTLIIQSNLSALSPGQTVRVAS